MIHLDMEETIVAISSPPGPGLRGILRLSGPRAWPVVRSHFVEEKPATPRRRTELRDGQLTIVGLRRPLRAAVAFWPMPRTYTGQDLVEIHTVGSRPLLELVLVSLLRNGARPAEPGEFTLRAYLNGRLDLSRAEAVLGVIHSQSRDQLDVALRQLAGGLTARIADLKERLLNVLAHLEAGLDFVDEHDVDPIGRAALADQLQTATGLVTEFRNQLEARGRPEGGFPRVVLVGPPNAGKSRLFNALVERGRAIVSPLPGTTRDYLHARCSFEGVAAELVDTAGVEDSRCSVELQAQSLGRAQAAGSDLLLVCVAADQPGFPIPLPDRPCLRIATKCDLAPAPADLIATSAATGLGLDHLRRAVGAFLRSRSGEGDPMAGSAARCLDILSRAGRSLRSASQSLHAGTGDDLVAVDVRQAIEELGEVVGDVNSEEILDRIFSRFCIGK